jgi:hypothetical protein
VTVGGAARGGAAARHASAPVQRLVLPLGAVPAGTPATPDTKDALVVRGKVDTITGVHEEMKGSNVEPNHQEADLTAPQPLAALAKDERLYIVAHGDGRTVHTYGPAELAEHLIALGLPHDYQGTIDLVACLAGVPQGSDGTFTHRFQESLYQRGERRAARRPREDQGQARQARPEGLLRDPVSDPDARHRRTPYDRRQATSGVDACQGHHPIDFALSFL